MMTSIVEEKLVSFKELEKKVLNMSVNWAVRSSGSCWRGMMKNWRRKGISPF